MLTRLLSLPSVVLLWLLHFLPLTLLAPLGVILGEILHLVIRQRRRVVYTNLALCFPELGAVDRKALARAHFRLLGRSLLERSIFWWSSRARIERIVRVRGEEILRDYLAAQRPVILLAPHFLGLDAGWSALSSRFDLVTFYAPQRSPLLDRIVRRGRSRFGKQVLLSRQDGVRPSVRAMKAGQPFYYLPDLNARRRDAVFVPFFGTQAATVTGLPRLARAADAIVLTCLTRMLPGGAGYEVEIGEAWADYPGDDPLADTARMNAWIENAVRQMPAQYYWVHRRFKTRPPGEARLY